MIVALDHNGFINYMDIEAPSTYILAPVFAKNLSVKTPDNAKYIRYERVYNRKHTCHCCRSEIPLYEFVCFGV